jgi:hypothetical protein
MLSHSPSLHCSRFVAWLEEPIPKSCGRRGSLCFEFCARLTPLLYLVCQWLPYAQWPDIRIFSPTDHSYCCILPCTILPPCTTALTFLASHPFRPGARSACHCFPDPGFSNCTSRVAPFNLRHLYQQFLSCRQALPFLVNDRSWNLVS